MNGSLGLLETSALTPALVAVDAMLKAAAVRVLQVELNDLGGVSVKITGSTAAVQTAIDVGRTTAEAWRDRPTTSVLPRPSPNAQPALLSAEEFSPLIQQPVVFGGASDEASDSIPMSDEYPQALGFLETQGFTAAFEAIDTACKAANVEVVGKEKLGGGYVTIVVQGELSAVSAAIASGQERVHGLGKLIAAHVIARPSAAVVKLLPRL